MKVLFFIRSLNAGGAERQLVVTAKGLAERGYDVMVLTCYDGGFYASELADTSVQLLGLHKKGRWDLFGFLFRLQRVLKEQSADVIYSFLGLANILTVIMRPFIPAARLVWGVRASNMDLDKYDWLARWSYWLECRLSRFADVIIANSNAGMDYAIVHGFPKEKMVVIPNGIDTDKFRPDKTAGEALREQWGISQEHKLIGVVGRIDPMKGIPTFLEAARLIRQSHSQVRFVWVGKGDVEYETAMRKRATELELDDVFIWAGRHTNMVAVYNAFDIASSSSSYGEGFPNVIGEAMACGVPCVVTDVGDSALVVGDVGSVVQAESIPALANGWSEMLLLYDGLFEGNSIASRKRVIDKFSIEALVNATQRILAEC